MAKEADIILLQGGFEELGIIIQYAIDFHNCGS